MRFLRPLAPIAATALLLCGAAAGAQEVSTDGLLQANVFHQRFGAYLADHEANTRQAEARLDLKVGGGRWELVARPRLRWRDTGTSIPGYPQPRRASLTEGYGSIDATDALRIGAGKRYLAWGPGLLYSPSNRLFPDNGSASPRQEIDGKTMAWASAVAGDGLQLALLAADPYLHNSPGVDRRGTFLLARAEHLATGDAEWGWGWVAGGGGGLRPYLGGHLQRQLGDAVTVALEGSFSRGYANAVPGQPVLRQNERRASGDAALSVRYGLPSGGELAAEYVYNGYHLTETELQLPQLALLPPSASTQSRYAARHPLAQRRYLMLQANLPRLFGRSRWTLFVRHLEALDRRSPGRLTFAELGYSPSDRVTLYLGLTVTHGAAASSLVRSLDRAAYITAELNF